MNKKIMILGASILQLPAIKQAKEMGLDVVVVDMNPDAIGFKEEGIEKEVISTIDIPKVLEAAKRRKIDGIMTLASDMPMRTVAVVAKELGLVGITEETALYTTNKNDMCSVLKSQRVPVPMFRRVNSYDSFLTTIEEIGGSLIAKPSDNSGSRGVIKINSKYSYDELKKAYLYCQSSSRNGDVIVEEFMEGPEVSVETLSIDGVCHVVQITDKLTTGAPNFVELGHSQPSLLDESIKEQIKKVAIDANRAVGIKNGPSHTEIIVTSSGPKIVEIGARLGGDCITTHLVPLSTGVDLVKCCIQIAIGEKPSIVSRFSKGSAIRYFKQKEGTIKSITGIDDALKINGVQQISIIHGVGERISNVIDSGSRMGFVVSSGKNAKEAVSICEKALSTICIEII